MNTKPFFLPSEVARLVLGYLVSEGFDQTSKRFLLECDCLGEFRKLKTMGLEYPTNILGLSLIEILDNFGFMKTQALERYNLAASTDCVWRELDACLDKLKHRMLQSPANKLNISKIRSQRKFPDRNVKALPDNIGEMLLKQGKILSSKQIAQNIRRVHETRKENEDLKENHPENSGSSNHLSASENLSRLDLQRAPPSIPTKDSSDIVVDEDVSVQIVDPPPTPLAEINEKEKDLKDDRHNYDGNRETTTADNLDTPHNTESISAQSPSHATETADNLPTTSRTSTKQHGMENPTTCVSTHVGKSTTCVSTHAGNSTTYVYTHAGNSTTCVYTHAGNTIPCVSTHVGNSTTCVSTHVGNTTPCVSTPKRQLSCSSEPIKTSTVECEVTVIPQQDVSASSPSKAPDTGCRPQLIEYKRVYQSVGTQSDLSPVSSTPQPNTSSNKPCVTTPMETVPSTPTATSLKSSPLVPESTPNTEHSPNTNALPSPDSGSEPLDVSNGENHQSTDSPPTAVETTSLSFSSSPPSLLGIPSSKASHSVYKTPVKTHQSSYRTPGKEYNQPETLNTPTRDKNNTLHSEPFTPSKQSEADNAKSKRKRFPPEKRFVDIPVPGPSQARSESGNSQDSSSLKDPIPTFVEKVISETSLAKVLADTINRKLYGEAANEVAAKISEIKNVEEGQEGECDKLMDDIMLTDFHMTKNDIDEVIHETRSAGIPVLDDLLKLFASVSEEKDNLSGDDEFSEPIYDDAEFEEVDSCSQSTENKEEIKLRTSGDDLCGSDPKTSENPVEPHSLSESQTTFLQVYSSAASTEPPSNQSSEDLSQKSFSTNLEDPAPNSENSENTASERLLASESTVKDIQTSENAKSLENPKQDPTSFESKEVPMTKQPSPCSRRAKVFSKGKSRKLVAAPVLLSTNENPAPIPPNTFTPAMSSSAPIPSPSANGKPSDTHSHAPQSNTTSLATDTRPNTTNLTLESPNKTVSTSSDIPVPISSSIHSTVDTTPLATSSTDLAVSSSDDTRTITETTPTTIPSELPAEYTSASLSNTLTTTTTTTTTSTSTLSITQVNSSLLVQQGPLPAAQRSKIISASISQNNSVVPRVIQPEAATSMTNYPVMYIITPPNMPPSQTPTLMLQPTPTSFATPNSIPLQITPSQTTTLQFQPTATSFATPNIPLQITSSQTPTLETRSDSGYTTVQLCSTQTQHDSASLSDVPQKSLRGRGRSNRPRGRPRKVPQVPVRPKIYNIAPNINSDTFRSMSVPLITEPVVPMQEKETLAVSTDNTWKIEMTPGTENVVLILKSPHTNELVNYQLTADQVKDHLASFIGTSAITEQVLRWMKKLKYPRDKNRPNILTPKKTSKNKKNVKKTTPEKQIVASENGGGGQTLTSGHQNNSPFRTPISPPFRTPKSEEIQARVQEGEEPILYVAKPLGKIEDFFRRTRAEINVGMESPRDVITISASPAQSVIEITDSPTSSAFENVSPVSEKTSPYIGKCSPDLHSSLSKEAEGHVQASPEIIGVPHLDLSSKEVSESCSQNKSNHPLRTTGPLDNENEFLAINILSSLCYSQSECCNKADPSVVISQPEETPAGHSFCDVSAASPAKCYKILMEGEEKESSVNAEAPVETPDYSNPVLQKRGHKPLDTMGGYVSPVLCKPREGTSEIEDSDLYSRYEDKSLVSCKKQELEIEESGHISVKEEISHIADTNKSGHKSVTEESGHIAETKEGGHIPETKGGNGHRLAEIKAESGHKSEIKAESGHRSETKRGSGHRSETRAESGHRSETRAESGHRSETRAESGHRSETRAESGHRSGTKRGSGHTSETEGSCHTSQTEGSVVKKSPSFKTKRPTKRKLYDPEEPKNVKKINVTDIDLLLTRLHPDSLDGYD